MTMIFIVLIAGLALRNTLRWDNPFMFAPPTSGRTECTELMDSADRRQSRYLRWMWNLREAEYETRYPETKARVNGVPAPGNAWPYSPSTGNQYWGTVRPSTPHLHRIDVV